MASVEGGSVAVESTVPVPGILRRVLPPERLAEIAQAVKAVQDKRGDVPITFLGSFLLVQMC